MKINFRYLIIVLFAAAAFVGCLKTNDLYEGFEDIKPIADFPLSHLSSDTGTVYALDIAPDANSTIDTVIAVHLSAKNHIGSVTFQVGLGVSDPAFQKYITDHPEYTLLPDSLYSFDSTVTIADAGVLDIGTFPIHIRTAAVDTSGSNVFVENQYILPIIIKDAGGYQIASNFRLLVMKILAKNKYDGIYTLKIRTDGWAAYNISDGVTRTWPSDFSLVTGGASSVTYDNASSGSAQNAFSPTGGLASFGATAPRLTFDLTTNKLVDVSNDAADDGRGRRFSVNPDVTDSRWDPATKNIYAAYIMYQNGRPNQMIYDTFTYKHAR